MYSKGFMRYEKGNPRATVAAFYIFIKAKALYRFQNIHFLKKYSISLTLLLTKLGLIGISSFQNLVKGSQ